MRLFDHPEMESYLIKDTRAGTVVVVPLNDDLSRGGYKAPGNVSIPRLTEGEHIEIMRRERSRRVLKNKQTFFYSTAIAGVLLI